MSSCTRSLIGKVGDGRCEVRRGRQRQYLVIQRQYHVYALFLLRVFCLIPFARVLLLRHCHSSLCTLSHLAVTCECVTGRCSLRLPLMRWEHYFLSHLATTLTLLRYEWFGVAI